MEINQRIYEILKEFKIDRDKGVIWLLAIYFNLGVKDVINQETIDYLKSTFIVERTPRGIIQWNIPLFTSQITDWDWVILGYNKMWDRNRERKAANADCIKRMQDWFKQYPKFRMQDVKQATTAYHNSSKRPTNF